MLAVLRFLFFNSGMSSSDVVTDLLNALNLLPDNPRMAGLTTFWMFFPFLVALAIYLFKKGSGQRECCTSWREVMWEFWTEAGSHLPFVSSLHNAWRTWRLHKLKYGMSDFKMSNHKEVEEILDAAGRVSQGESNYEAGPQAVTQVSSIDYFILDIFYFQLVIMLTTGQWSYIQVISLIMSVLSLSWGASR